MHGSVPSSSPPPHTGGCSAPLQQPREGHRLLLGSDRPPSRCGGKLQLFALVKQLWTFITELLLSVSHQVDKLTAEYVWKWWKFKIQCIFLSLWLSFSQKIWLHGHNYLCEDREQMSVQPSSTELPNSKMVRCLPNSSHSLVLCGVGLLPAVQSTDHASGQDGSYHYSLLQYEHHVFLPCYKLSV